MRIVCIERTFYLCRKFYLFYAMMKNSKFLLILTAVLFIQLFTPYAAFADSMMSSDLDKDTIIPQQQYGFGGEQFVLDEILVLSQPKETQRLREQPVSATTFTSADVKNLGNGSLQRLADFTPSFAMPLYGSRLTSSTYIRGAGARIGYSPIGMYIDGTPVVSRSAHNIHLYEVERVDVLRGPQGTLYGQNSEAGLLRIFTKSPLYNKGTNLNITAANGRQLRGEIMHYTMLSKNVGIAAGMFVNMQRGFFKNTNLNQYADSLNELGGRLRLAWKANDNLTLDVMADYQYVHERAFPYGLVESNGAFAQLPSTTFTNTYRRNLLRTGVNLAWKTQHVHFFSNTSYQYLRDRMLMDQDYVARDYFALCQQQLHNALTQEFVLRSPTSYADKGHASVDAKKYHWLFGLYGAYQWLKTDAPVSFGEGITSPISTGVRNAMYGAILQQMIQAFIGRGMTPEQATVAAQQMIEQRGGISMTTSMYTPGMFHTPEWNVAIYHESNYNITSRLRITAGLRYDYSHVSIKYDTQSQMDMTANVMGAEATYSLLSVLQHNTSNHFNQLLPRFAVTYTTDTEHHNNIYMQVSKGYRAGGYNIQMFSDVLRQELNDNSSKVMSGSYEIPHTDEDYKAIDKTISYKPEVTWNYELGTHQNIPLSARNGSMLRIDASLFYMQVRDRQLTVMAGNYGFGRRMVNTGRSYSCGLELALSGTMMKTRLNWMLNYSYNHTAFKRYSDIITTTEGDVEVDYTGNHVPYAPEHMLSAAVSYRHDFASQYILRALTFGVNTNMQGKIYWNEANTQWQKVYALLGASIHADFGLIGLTLWTRNLTNTHYHTFLVESSAAGSSMAFAQRGLPRQVGVDLSICF